MINISDDWNILREVTDWSKAGYNVPNHDYILNNTQERMIAYRKNGSDQWEKFIKPIPFSKTRRKFKRLKGENPQEFITPITADLLTTTTNSLEEFFQ